MNNDIDLAERLLQRKADVNAFFRGKTPVMRALKYSSHDVLQLLLESPTLNINLQNQAQESALWRGRTALHLAVWWGKTGLAHLLLSSGSDPFTTDDFGKPSAGIQTTDNSELPLHQAVAHGSAGAVELLLTQKELALNAQDHNGDTPLHLAVRCRRLAVVELLLSHPCADIGRGQTQSPSTSLHHARGDTVVLRWLLKTPGIDPNLCVAGVSPFSAAAAKGSTHAMAMLLNKGGLEINATELADSPPPSSGGKRPLGSGKALGPAGRGSGN
ncbi:hypothetical protein N7509_000124 [Penicillium cosmopolitanum]|uniref:Uncharacterized protein n=1 Tax=Penicillium cosmopolitanum TaxID=1131564 RepID=A0A9W9WCP0_9EURO|nr:uncharacterized protein N7509_000124 [Penicillium cosmopolitanum]KAJ5415026.1 hypothetical protein N7509_000124 [Penicillium cosmopolitanum]